MKRSKCLNCLFSIILFACFVFVLPLNSKAALSQPRNLIVSRDLGDSTFIIPTNTKDSALSFDTVSELKEFTRNNDNIGTEVTFYAYVLTSWKYDAYPDGSYYILYLASDKKGTFPIYGVGIPDDLVVYEGDLIYYTGIFDGNSFNGNTWPTFRTINISFDEPIDESDSFMSNEEAGDFVDVSDPSGYASLRSGPGMNYDQLYAIPNGENVLVLSATAKHTNIQDKDWVEASYFIDGDWHDGWIQKSQLKYLY